MIFNVHQKKYQIFAKIILEKIGNCYFHSNWVWNTILYVWQHRDTSLPHNDLLELTFLLIYIAALNDYAITLMSSSIMACTVITGVSSGFDHYSADLIMTTK